MKNLKKYVLHGVIASAIGTGVNLGAMDGNDIAAAADGGHQAIVENGREQVERVNGNKFSSLLAALEKGDVVGARNFVRAAIPQVTMPCVVRDRMLYDAARTDYDQTLTALFLGADVNAGFEGGLTPLYQAVFYNQKAIVSLLLTCGAHVDMSDENGETLLHCAALRDAGEIAKLLMEYSADVNAKSTNEETPLHCAVSTGRTKVTRLLLDNRAEVNAADSAGDTPLHYAARGVSCELVSLLLGNGANRESINKKGKTPLAIAASYDEHRLDFAQRGAVAKLLRGSEGQQQSGDCCLQ